MPNKKKYFKKPEKIQKIAREQIKILFQLAKEVFKKDSKLSDKYVRLARKVAMKHKIRLSSEQKKRICKNCRKYLVPSINCRVRIHKHRLIYYCFGCKHFMRFNVK